MLIKYNVAILLQPSIIARCYIILIIVTFYFVPIYNNIVITRFRTLYGTSVQDM